MITVEQAKQLKDGDKVIYTVPNPFGRNDFVIECEVWSPTEEEVRARGLFVGDDILKYLRDTEQGFDFFISVQNVKDYHLLRSRKDSSAVSPV